MERKYYAINETMARTSHNMMSMSDYVTGSKTAEYRREVDAVYDTAEEVSEKRPRQADKAWKIAYSFASRLADNMNNDLRIGTMCPSILVSGRGNFPVKKKQKQVAAWDRNMEEYNKIMELKRKLEHLLYATEVIRSDDEDALMLLEEKLSKLEESQTMMKEVNAYYRKHKTLEGCPELSEKQIKEITEGIASVSYHDVPYPSWCLTNNNQNIHRIRDRIAQLEKEKSNDTHETEIEDLGITVEENVEDMRIRLIFPGKPVEKVRDILKSHGFRWSPQNGAWQRQLNDNGRYAVKTVLKQVRELDIEIC